MGCCCLTVSLLGGSTLAAVKLCLIISNIGASNLVSPTLLTASQCSAAFDDRRMVRGNAHAGIWPIHTALEVCGIFYLWHSALANGNLRASHNA
jgi:hypothetical protein